MAVYPESLTKISDASIRKINENKGQNLKKWTKDDNYPDYTNSYIVGINIKEGEENGKNVILPAYDFIEKVADAVILEYSELSKALSDVSIRTIFLAKDIRLEENITISGNKDILGISSVLDFNGKTLTIGNNAFYAYCKISGTGRINGTGTIWLKDVLVDSQVSTDPISSTSTNKYFERFVNISDYKTTYTPDGWQQRFVDNTFPWKNIIDKINTDINNERIARESADTAETTARKSADTALQSSLTIEITNRTNEDTRLEGLIETEKDRAMGAESALADAITNAINTEVTNRNTAIETAINTEVNNRNTAIETAINTEVNNRNDAIEAAIHSVYKPKGNITRSQLEALAPSTNRLGEVYNVIGLTEKTTINLTDSAGASYSIEVSPEEDVGCVNTGTDDSPVYRWNDFGGKIDLSNYYVKSEVDSKVTAAKSTITQGDNIDLSSSTAADGHTNYTIHSNLETVSLASTNNGLSLTESSSSHTVAKTLSLQLVDSNDIDACTALFNNL